MNSEERREKIKKQVKKLGLRKSVKTVKVTCANCHVTKEINTNNPLMYTEEVIKNYRCFKCKLPKEEKKQNDQKDAVEVKQKIQQENINIEKGEVKKIESKTLKIVVREDGVLRFHKRIIEDYNFKGGDSCIVEISNGKIVITKEV